MDNRGKLQVKTRLGLLTLGATPFLAGPLLLLVVARTAAGCFTALSLLVGLSAVLIVMPGLRGRPHRWTVTGIGLLVAGLLFGVAVIFAPAGRAAAKTGFSSIYQGAPTPRWSLTNVVPERDQLIVGSYPIQLLDSRLGFHKAQRLRRLVGEIYAEANADPDFRETRSVLGEAYANIVSRNAPDHGYLYVPPGATEPLPVLVFLHGAMGNFQAYSWVLKALADKHGIAIYCPTFGAGMWQLPEGLPRLERAIQFCKDDPRLDGEQLVLACLSQGGYGGWWGASKLPTAFRGYIFISPVLAPDMANNIAVTQMTARRPFLVIHGEQDARIPISTVQQSVKILQAAGLRVEFSSCKEEDHFLFFNQRAEILTTIGDWLAANDLVR